QSRESMIIRKMRNNIVKKIPKDFGNAFVEMTYQEAADETYSEVKREIAEHANGEIIDIEMGPVSGKENETQPDQSDEHEQQPQDSKPNQGVMDFEDFSGDIPPIENEGPDSW